MGTDESENEETEKELSLASKLSDISQKPTTPVIAKRAGGVAGRRLPTRKGKASERIANEAEKRLAEAEKRREEQKAEIARRREEKMKLLEEEEARLAKLSPEEKAALEEKEEQERKKREEAEAKEKAAAEAKRKEEERRKEEDKQKMAAIQGALGSLKKAPAKRPEPAYRLLCLKGKRRVRVHLVEVNAKSLNHGDVFILDAKTTLY